MQDHEIIKKIKTGDMTAFQELFERYQKLVINVCYRLVGDKNEAEDLTQDVFLKTFKSACHSKHHAKVFTWIYRIAINLSLNHLRKKKYQQWFSLDDISTLKEPLAFEMVCSVGAVQTRLHRAKKNLYRKLLPYFKEI